MDFRFRQWVGLIILGALLVGEPRALPAQVNNDREVLFGAYREGEKLKQQAKYAEAIQAYEKAVALADRVFGANDLNTANLMRNLANLYRIQVKYQKAEPLYQRSLKIAEAKLGTDHPYVATSLNGLAGLYQDQGQCAKAEKLYQRGLKIREAKLGKDHPEVATGLNNLATLYLAQGQYGKAEPLLLRSLKIWEAKLGKDHPEVATSLNNLASLYQDQGQYGKAEPLYQRSLKIREAKLGKHHPDVANSLNNLADLYREQGQFRRAERFFQRSLIISEARLGKDHPAVAASLNNLGVLYQAQGQYTKVEPLLLRSLKIREAKLGKDHLDVAISLNNLAVLYQDQGQYGKAESHYQRCLEIWEANQGKDHPSVGISLSNLAGLSGARQRWQDAAKVFDRARRGTREHANRVLPALAPREQLLFLRHKGNASWFKPLSLALQQSQEAGLSERSASWLINGKALTQEAMAESLLLSRAGDHPELRGLMGRLLDTRKQLANLTLAIPKTGQEKGRLQQIEALTLLEEKHAKELGQKSGQHLEKQPWVELKAVRKAMPSDGVFIDIARFPVYNFQAKGKESRWGPERYVAWVIPPENKGKVQLIDLGEASKIEAAVVAVRSGLQKTPVRQGKGKAEAEKALGKPLQDLATLILKPLLPHIGKKQRWIISPDASLWLVPWGALPLADGSYAVEKYAISHVISGRNLVSQGDNAPRSTKVKLTRPLVLADPDFDLLASPKLASPKRERGEGPNTRSLLPEEKLPRFARLPGTAAEAKAIAPLLERYDMQKPEVLTGKAALEKAFKAARNPRVLVLSTHGFFLEDQADVVPPMSSALVSRGLQLITTDLPRPKGKTVKALENPLLRCGLALAGANQRDKAPEGAEDGILTGLEIVGTDLRGTELVVLSACDSGLGEVRNGEGVAGLRQAFQLAGAQAVVATLWQIPDKETTALMTAFFENLAAKKGKAEALRLAQLQIIKERRAKHKEAHPFYWAAFTITGNTQ